MICNTYTQFFGTLADQTKMHILRELRKGPKTVTELSRRLRFEQSRISHNLRKLRELGFVDVKPNGKQRIYKIDGRTILPLLKLTDKHVDTYYRHYCKCRGKESRKRKGRSER